MSKDNRQKKSDLERKVKKDPNGEKLEQATEEFKKALLDASHEKTRKALKSIVEDMGKDLAADLANIIRENMGLFEEQLEEWEALQPYIAEELKKPEYKGKTLEEIAKESGADTEKVESIIDAARANMLRPKPPQIQYHDSHEIKANTDKLANVFFSTLPLENNMETINGQRTFAPLPLKYEGDNDPREITVQYDYTFNEAVIKEFNLPKSFGSLGFFVSAICDNLYDEGNTTVSITKIWHELGCTGSPAGNDPTVKKVLQILRLGMSTILTVDPTQIAAGWGKTDDVFKHKLISPVIPVQILEKQLKANGRTTDATINITGHSPFYLLGAPLKRYSTWKKEVLQLYSGRRTERYYSVMKYLLINIGWLRHSHSKRSNKITYKDLYKATGAKTTRDKQLTKNMLYKIIDEAFMPTGYITKRVEATEGEPGVILTVKKDKMTDQQRINTKKK